MSAREKSLGKRLMNYPSEVAYAERLYADTLAAATKLEIHQDGDVTEETEQLRMKLRAYDLSLTACGKFCEDLLENTENDMVLLDALAKKMPNNCDIRESIATLSANYTTLKVMHGVCEAHREVVERARKTIRMAQEQQSLKRLVLLVDELKTLDRR